MAQFGGDQQYMKQKGHQTEDHVQNPTHSTTATHDIGGTGTNVHSTTAGHDMGGTKTPMGTVDGHGHEEGQKMGVVEKIKEKLPRSDHGDEKHATPASATVGGGGCGNGEEGHKKKGLMDQIKDKLPGVGNQ